MSTTGTNPVIQPYLFFDGRCEEALEFYRTALEAEITTLMRFKDSPEPPRPGMSPGTTFRHGRRPLWRVMDGDRRAGGTGTKKN